MKTKKIICLILSMAILFCSGVITSVAATSSDSTTSNVKWSFDKNTGVLTIYGKGDMNELNGGDVAEYPWSTDYYFERVTSVVVSEGITSIGRYAFYNLDEAKNIIIPNTVTHIDEYSFSCFKLQHLDIPASVNHIDKHAFWTIYRLESFNVDKNNKKYSSMDGILYNKNKTEIIKYPEGKKDTSIVIPKTVKTIKNNAFSFCDNLNSVTISNSVTTIEQFNFSYCSNLATVNMGNSVQTIGPFAFTNCKALTAVSIPKSCSSIDYTAFNKCDSLTDINVHKDNKYFSSVNGVLYDKNKTKLFKYPNGKNYTSFTIPDSVKSIETDAFAYNKYLESVKIPNSVAKIHFAAFEYCTNLKSIRIPDKVTELMGNIFDNCDNLQSISLPNSLTFIDSDIFSNDTNFKYITFRGRKSQWDKIRGTNYTATYYNCTVNFDLEENQYFVKSTLNKVSNNNKNEIAVKDQSYNAKLTPKKGYALTDVKVTMNDKSIKTSFTQKACNIKIKKVNGDIVISATAKKIQTISAKSSFTKKKKSKPFYIKAKAKTKLTYSSSNKKVATVSNKGKVKIKGVGKTTITIKAKSSSSYTSATKKITIKVKK